MLEIVLFSSLVCIVDVHRGGIIDKNKQNIVQNRIKMDHIVPKAKTINICIEIVNNLRSVTLNRPKTIMLPSQNPKDNRR